MTNLIESYYQNCHEISEDHDVITDDEADDSSDDNDKKSSANSSSSSSSSVSLWRIHVNSKIVDSFPVMFYI